MAGRIQELARDRTSGAAELALRAAELLALASPDELPAAAQAVIQAQPAMAPVYNAAQAALGGRLPEFLARLRQSRDALARKAASLIAGRTVLTHSYSSTVVQAVRHAPPARLLCTESLPGGEGRRTASLLHGEVIADAAMYSALAGVEIAVVGADAVTPAVVVNKLGTALLALAARARGVPVWVLCGTEKFVPAAWNPDLGELFEATPRAWFTGVLDDADAGSSP